jgi:hypothetical protein
MGLRVLSFVEGSFMLFIGLASVPDAKYANPPALAHPVRHCGLKHVKVTVGSNCTNFLWISTTVSPQGGGGLAQIQTGGESNPMNNMKIPSTKNNTQQVIYSSGDLGTTVFQIQDSTGTLGGTYTVNVVAQ